MTNAEAHEKLKASGFTEQQAAGLTDYVDRRLAQHRGKLTNGLVVVLLIQTLVVLGGMGFMLFLATIINHVWR